ncbi:MAG: hypothetical protein CR982_08015 [Candidatus Cloacimonadota bacterium]|nr:MAG: hypothetical protein CR982_08015 [Candidatus Cloacimonadota bacterium]
MKKEIFKVIGIIAILMAISIVYIYFSSDKVALYSDREVKYTIDKNPLKIGFFTDFPNRVEAVSYSQSMYGFAKILGKFLNDSVEYFDNNIEELTLFQSKLENTYFVKGLKDVGLNSIEQLENGQNILDSSYILTNGNSINFFSKKNLNLNSTVITCGDSAYFIVSSKLFPIIIVDRKNRIKYLNSKIKKISFNRNKEIIFYRKLLNILNDEKGNKKGKKLLLNSIRSYIDPDLSFHSNKFPIINFLNLLFSNLEIDRNIENYKKLVETFFNKDRLEIVKTVYRSYLNNNFPTDINYTDPYHEEDFKQYLYINNGKYIIRENGKTTILNNWINRIRENF